MSALGLATRLLDSAMVPMDSNGGFSMAICAIATPRIVVSPQGSDGLWIMTVGPNGENGTAIAASDALSMIQFAHMFLSKFDGAQVYDFSENVEITLPKGASLLNADELS